MPVSLKYSYKAKSSTTIRLANLLFSKEKDKPTAGYSHHLNNNLIFSILFNRNKYSTKIKKALSLNI